MTDRILIINISRGDFVESNFSGCLVCPFYFVVNFKWLAKNHYPALELSGCLLKVTSKKTYNFDVKQMAGGVLNSSVARGGAETTPPVPILLV